MQELGSPSCECTEARGMCLAIFYYSSDDHDDSRGAIKASWLHGITYHAVADAVTTKTALTNNLLTLSEIAVSSIFNYHLLLRAVLIWCYRFQLCHSLLGPAEASISKQSLDPHNVDE